MRLHEILVEAARNLRSGTARAGVLAAVLAVIATGLSFVDVQAVNTLQHKALDFDRSGASTRVLAVDASVDAASCRALRSVAGVRATGALKARGVISALALPANTLPAYVVSPQLGDVLGVRQVRAEGVWLPEPLAATLHVSPGDVLPTTEGPMTVAGLYPYPKDGRDARLAYAVLVPSATQAAFDECWARIWPANPRLDDLLRGTAVIDPGATQNLVIGQLNNNFGADIDPSGDYHARPTRFAGIGTALVAFALGLFVARRRRLEYASALHAGQARSAQVATAVAETVCWSAAGLLVALGAVTVLVRETTPQDHLAVVAGQLGGLGLALVTTSMGVVAGLLMTRESHLFGYFKDR